MFHIHTLILKAFQYDLCALPVPKNLLRLYLLMTQLKVEELFIRDYVVVRRLIPSGGKRLELTFISDLPRQKERERARVERGTERQEIERVFKHAVCVCVCTRTCVCVCTSL